MLRTDPEKVRAWHQRSRTPLQRSAIRKSSKTRLGRGPRMRAWEAVWRWLEPKLRAAGRTKCEFGFLVHECWGKLDPAHSKKRRKMEGLDVYVIARACRQAHEILDGHVVYKPFGRRLNQAEMEQAVLLAIELNGGIILPNEREMVRIGSRSPQAAHC
jgi:hypothetical protein